mgnify:CR=1 FL=1
MEEKTPIDELLKDIDKEIERAMADPPAHYFAAGLRKARSIICKKFKKRE